MPRRSSSTSKKAARTETTVNDTRDFGVGRLLTDENWNALIDIGHQINQRLLEHQLDACACAPDATLLERVVLPSATPDGAADDGILPWFEQHLGLRPGRVSGHHAPYLDQPELLAEELRPMLRELAAHPAENTTHGNQ